MGVGEVDLYSGLLLDALVVEHLVALVPGQGAAQRWRQGAEHADEGITELLR
jgi:hypothetical protein